MRVRHFQRQFGKLNAKLKPGEKVTITTCGKVQGIYERSRQRQTRKRLREIVRQDFQKILDAPYTAEEGAAAIRLLQAQTS